MGEVIPFRQRGETRDKVQTELEQLMMAEIEAYEYLEKIQRRKERCLRLLGRLPLQGTRGGQHDREL